MSDNSSTINTNAQSPAEVEQDGTHVKANPIPDQIAADRYAATQTAKGRKSTGLSFFKIKPPGAV